MPVDEQALALSIDTLSGALRALDGHPVPSLVGHLAEVVAAANDLLGVEAVGVLLLDETGALRAVASSHPAAEALELAQQRLGIGPGHDTLARNDSVLVSDLTAVAAYAPLLAELGPPSALAVRAVLSAPIRIDAEVVGNLNLMRLEVHRWSEAETRAAEAYAEVVGRLLQMGARGQSSEPARGTFAAGHADEGCERDADQR
jgi:transcriptional regulator with GAF, ATPase, and Fis domain